MKTKSCTSVGDSRVKRVTAADIKQGYTPEKAQIDLVSHLWLYLVVRRVSFLLTPLFVNLGFSANAVTVLGLLPLASGLVLLTLGAVNYSYFIVGAALVNIWALFDCIDGDVARFRGQSSKFGALLDTIAGLIYHTSLLLCLGLGLYRASPEQLMLPLGLELPRWCWLVAGAVESSTGLFRKVVSFQSQSGVEWLVRKQENLRITIWTVLPRAVLSFKAPLLLIASLIGALDVFLFGYVAYNLASLIAMVSLALRKALLADRQQFDKGEDL